MILAGLLVIATEMVRLMFYQPPLLCFPEPLSKVRLEDGNPILSLTAFVFGFILILGGVLAKKGYILMRPVVFLSSVPVVLYGYTLGLTIGYWRLGVYQSLWTASLKGYLILTACTAPFFITAFIGGIFLLLGR